MGRKIETMGPVYSENGIAHPMKMFILFYNLANETCIIYSKLQMNVIPGCLGFKTV